MAPFCAFDVKEDDVGEAHWNVTYEGGNLVSKVSAPLILHDVTIAFCASCSILPESDSKTNEHCDKAIWHVY